MSVALAQCGLVLSGVTALVGLAATADLGIAHLMDWLARRYRDQQDRG